MQIQCERSPFIGSVDELLRELSRVNFFEQSLLVGSWPMVVYTQYFRLAYGLATDDIDFAVVNTLRKQAGVALPELLERIGYTELKGYPDGVEKYVQGTFEVEFLMHRRGGAAPPAVNVPAWQIAAQPLPFIDILFIHPTTVSVEDYVLKIPSPEALVVHKLIVAQRRDGSDKEWKKEKDLQQCVALAEVVRVTEVQHVLKKIKMSKTVRKDIAISCEDANLNMSDLGLIWG